MIYENALRPLKNVSKSLALGLARHPQFEVFKAIVVSNAVDMVDVLVRVKLAAKVLLHDNAVLKLGLPVSRPLYVAATCLMFIPTIGIRGLLFYAATLSRAFLRTALDVSVWLRQELLAADHAAFWNKRSLSSGLVGTRARTVSNPVFVRGFAFEVDAATKAGFGNGWLSKDARFSSVNAGWHWFLRFCCKSGNHTKATRDCEAGLTYYGVTLA